MRMLELARELAGFGAGRSRARALPLGTPFHREPLGEVDRMEAPLRNGGLWIRRSEGPWGRAPARLPRGVRALTAVVTVAALASAGACGGAAGGAVSAPPAGAPAPVQELARAGAARDTLVPPGYGTLRQDDVTLSLRSEALLIKVTPLAEWVIRLLAPDTYDRLSGLAHSQREAVARQVPVRDPLLFLVSFFSYAPNVTYQPEDLQLLSHGRRYRPLAIVPVTAGWGVQRLDQQQTQMAVYAFDPEVDLTAALVIEYRQSRNETWERIVPRLEEEWAKVRARARK